MARLIVVIIDVIYCKGCGIRWTNQESKDGHVTCPLCQVEIIGVSE